MKLPLKKNMGLIHVYTGEGKGKTTSSLGIALRAVGHGYTVYVIQFLKGWKEVGEWKIQQRLKPHLQVFQFGQPQPVDLVNPSPTDIYLANEGLNFSRKVVQDRRQRPDVLILDEVNVAVAAQMIALKEMLDFVDNIPSNMELVLTGRSAHPDIVERAHLVTEMRPIKHYYDGPIGVRPGIDH